MKTTTISMIMVLGILCSSNHVLASDLSNLQSNSSIACIFAPPILHDAAKLIPGGSFGDGESTEAKATASIMQIRRLQFTAQDGSNGTPVTLDSIRLIGVSISLDTLLVGTTELLLDVTTGMDAVLKEGDFNVSTNYPNPFGSQTQFEVFSPSSSPVTINLYAPNGKRITTFQSSLVHGVSRFVLHGASMPAGIYMLEVIGGKGQRKLTRLMKTASSGTGSVRIESVGSTTDLNPTMGKISAMLSLQVTGYADGYKEQTHTVQVESDTTISFTLYADIPVPPAPSNLTAEAVSSSQINLVWQDNSDNEQMFKIGRRAPSGTRDPGGAVHYTEIGTVSQNVTSYQDLGLTADKSYSYIVVAYNPQAGDSEESNMATASTYADIPVPAAASNLTATAISSSQIDLTWADNSDNEDGFRLERAPGGTTNFIQIAILPASVISYENTGLSDSTSYSYRILAYNNLGNSSYSNTATGITMSDGVPTAPSNLTATAVSSSQINLVWQDNSDNEQMFKIGRRTPSGTRDPGGAVHYTEIGTVSQNVTSYQDLGLTASKSYSYVVVAYDPQAGDSEESNPATGVTMSDGVPPAPSNLTAEAVSSSQINLVWQDNSDNEQMFKIGRRAPSGTRDPGGTVHYTEIGTVSQNVTSYQDLGLTANKSYSYIVIANNPQAGDSEESNMATVSTYADIPVPAAPTKLKLLTSSTSSIHLLWFDKSDNEDGFLIERAPGGTSNFTQIADIPKLGRGYTNTGLASSTSYSYRVRAYNAGGNSAYSNIATETTMPGGVPAAPTHLTATAVSTYQIDLSWQDNSDNESRFEIRRTLSGTTDWEVIKSLGKNETSYQDKNDGSNDLEASTSYSYVVIAANNEGASGSSNLVIATTHAEPPVGLDIRGPSTAYGLFQVSVTYDKWPTTASRNDSYYLEESTTSSRWGFTEIQKSPSPTRTSPYFFNIQRDPGTYHYRARVFVGAGPNPGYTDYSDVITVVSQAQPNAILRIVNQSRYALVDIRLNGIQMVEQDEGLSVGRSKEYDFRNSRTVDFIVGRGNWSLGAREIMLPFDSGSVEVVAGETREMLVVKTSIIQLFTNGQPYQDWEGDYRDEASVKHTLVFRFTGDGRWSFFADGEAMGSGIVTLDSWDDYATNAKFKLGDNRIGIFSIIADGFIYPNGPPNDPKVSYFRQN
jgi:fibronectin type III domain protein